MKGTSMIEALCRHQSEDFERIEKLERQVENLKRGQERLVEKFIGLLWNSNIEIKNGYRFGFSADWFGSIEEGLKGENR